MLFRFTLQATLATAAATATATATPKVDDEKPKKDPFVPQKLKQKYDKILSNKKSNTIIQTLKDDADDLILQNQKAVPIQPILLKNSVTTTDTTTSGGTLEDIEEAFDASSQHELGILANAKSNVRTQQQRKLSVECDGKHPVVNPTLNFFALVRRCLVPAYQDNCPFDIDLPLDCWDTSQVSQSLIYSLGNAVNFEGVFLIVFVLVLSCGSIRTNLLGNRYEKSILRIGGFQSASQFMGCQLGNRLFGHVRICCVVQSASRQMGYVQRKRCFRHVLGCYLIQPTLGVLGYLFDSKHG